MSAEGVQYRITGPPADVPNPLRKDAVAAAVAFFHHDRPTMPCAVDVSTDGGSSWQRTSPGSIARDARRELAERSRQGYKIADVEEVLSAEQGEWLWQHKITAAEQGLSSNAASQQAIREWVLRIGGVAPMPALSAFSQLAWSAGEMPGDMGWDRSADSLTWALRDVGRTLQPTVDGGTGPVPSAQFRSYWLALAACGPAHPEAVSGARWHLEQAVRTDPALYEHAQQLRSVGVPEEQALLLAAVALTLQVSGYPKQAEQFLQMAASDPAALAAWVSSPERASVIQDAQQLLASHIGRVAHGGPHDQDIHRASLPQIAYAATQLILVSSPPMHLQSATAAAVAAFARNLIATIAERRLRTTPPRPATHDQQHQQIAQQQLPGTPGPGR